jgi:hypothetical protein
MDPCWSWGIFASIYIEPDANESIARLDNEKDVNAPRLVAEWWISTEIRLRKRVLLGIKLRYPSIR